MREFSSPEIRDLLTDIVEGRIVKRSKHLLRFEARDVSLEFMEVLLARGYRPMLVRDVPVDPGERVPAFFVEEGTAYFGWVFWEKFSRLKLRKLFGSVVRNAKGDWAVQISERRNSVIHANPALKSEMDIEHPSGF
jgi:hypothetical protein